MLVKHRDLPTTLPVISKTDMLPVIREQATAFIAWLKDDNNLDKIEHLIDIGYLEEERRKIEAVNAFVKDKATKVPCSIAARWCEMRIGSWLGATAQGERTDLTDLFDISTSYKEKQQVTTSSAPEEVAVQHAVIRDQSKQEFRFLAEHRPQFEGIAGAYQDHKRVLTRAQLIREIKSLLSGEGEDRPLAGFRITSDQSTIQCDALITDPPYGILDEDWEPKELELFTRHWASKWNDCGAKCALVFWSQRYLWDGRRWFDDSLSGYEFQQLLVWHYPNNKKPQSRAGFKQTWEPIFFYRKRDSNFIVQPTNKDWGKGLNNFDCHVAAIPQSNFNESEFKVHPAQKPVSALLWLINAVTGKGDLVCDPFCGSGTTGIAAMQLGRRFHGIEKDKEYATLATKRINSYGHADIRII